ncbi:MAG: hypothetical protein B7Y45_11085 [Sphingomonas sp. 28-66-16]|nr:MAG: hypothetical protein B7Y45_11085 [Sphingomonas sp. 28-66-16]
MRHVYRSHRLIDPALLTIWARGWAVSRGVPPPVEADSVLTTEVGLPDQRRRHLLLDAPNGLATLAATIDMPFVLIKAPIPAATVAALLPGHWHVERTGTMMTIAVLCKTATAWRDGYRAVIRADGGTTQIDIVDPAGGQAGRGRMTVIEDHAIFDQIVIDPAHRRRGLGRALMLALANQATAAGARAGILTATDMGLGLYRQLGWVDGAPWTTAQIRP